MQEETKETSFSKFFKTVWRQKWIALIVAVVVTVLCVVTIYYGYNPGKESYTMEFSLNLPGDTGSVVYIYPNGKQFYYSDITSLDNLKSLKKDPAFKDVDVEKMANNGHINIQRDISVMTDSATESSTAYREISYTISVKASYFESEWKARDFLKRLADTPANYLSEMNIKYGVYLDMAEKAEDYEDEIGFLKAQLNDIQSKYSTLIKTYGDSFVVENGKTLLAYSQEAKAYNDSKVLDNLLTEARNKDNPYIKNESYKENYKLQLEELKKEYDKANTTLQTLLSVNNGDPNSTTTVVFDASVIKAQQDLVTDLDNQIKIIQNYIDNGTENAEYDKKVTDAFNNVKAFTESYSTASATVYEMASSVVYLNPGIVALQGGLSLVKIVVISLVAGIVMALIVGYAAGYLSLKKEKQKSAETSNAVVAGQKDEENEEK